MLYGFFIILIYDLLTLLITIVFGANALNGLASNIGVNIFFFLIFVIFAASFLGAFEITLPASWINKADNASERGGIVGIFFMAFTLVLVSFSCTGPVVGSLLPLISNGTYLGPIAGMTGFGLCLALPFALFAMFPSWLHTLPKSGGWLNSVKVVLGILELALAIKFLSNADLVAGWHLISRELFIAIWIVAFGMMGFYLLGKLKFSHDSDLPYLTVTRTLLAMLVLSFTVYLIPGLWGAPLNLISGFPPPQTQDWSENYATFQKQAPRIDTTFHDYDQALSYARQVHKPLFVDFTGWTCVNCRKMEQKVWIKPEIHDLLQNNYVVVSLYVDDKINGQKWSTLETTRFNNNAQPWYILIGNDGKELNAPIGFTDAETFKKFLDVGLNAFKK